MNVIVLASTAEEARRWQYAVEDLGDRWRCTPVLTAAAAMRQLPGAQVMLVLPGREGEKWLRMAADNPPMAPPYILGGPDGSLPGPEELPPLLERWRREEYLPALCGAYYPMAREMAAALLRTLGVPQRLRAWTFLPDMIALTVVHPLLLEDLQHGLYPLLARRYGMSAAGVERSLRLCVESTWMHGRLPALERFFADAVDPEKGKPTNRAFLRRMREKVTEAMQRLI